MDSWKEVYPFSRLAKSKFGWCFYCERVHKTKSWEKNYWTCPTKGCRADVISAYPWTPESIPRRNNPDYPDIPIEGKIYPRNAGKIDLSFLEP